MAWKYEKGQWNISDVDDEDIESWDKNDMVVREVIYKHFESMGDPTKIESISIYESSVEEKYLVEFCVGHTTQSVFIKTFPDLMDWLAKYSSYFYLKDRMNHPYRR